MTTEQLLTKIREFATDNYCSCEGRIHDPENLMEKLLQECEKWEKEMNNEDWKKEFFGDVKHVNPNCFSSKFCKPHGETGAVKYDVNKIFDFIQSLLEKEK